MHNGQFYLRGLVSASLMNQVNQCDIHKEAIFTDVTKYYDWIKSSVSSAPEARLEQPTTTTTSILTTMATTTTSSSYSVTSRTTMRFAFGGPIWD